jgi:hypothetical protein
MKVIFRDGERDVPDYVGMLLIGIDTFRLTYEEALRRMDAEIVGDYLRTQQSRIVTEHFKTNRR